MLLDLRPLLGTSGAGGLVVSPGRAHRRRRRPEALEGVVVVRATGRASLQLGATGTGTLRASGRVTCELGAHTTKAFPWGEERQRQEDEELAILAGLLLNAGDF